MPKLLPISQTVLPKIRDEGYVFIDKTRYLEIYENCGRQVSLFLRPRRFGKTMFTELLRYYYDVALESESVRLFRDTYIGTRPTPKKSSLHVVKFDFSGIDTCQGFSIVLESFIAKIVNGIDDFFRRYPELIPLEIRNRALSEKPSEISLAVVRYYRDRQAFPTPASVIDSFVGYLGYFSPKVMIIIDEYDNFTNDILSRDPGVFASIARKDGEISRFYQCLRARLQQQIIDSIFITGVLPVTLDTSLSGFVYSNISAKVEFNGMAGFTDQEVLELLHETVDFEQCGYSPDELLAEMKLRYDGYRFAEAGEETVYNTSLCLNFIEDLVNRRYAGFPSLQSGSDADLDFEKFSGFLDLIRKEDLDNLLSSMELGCCGEDEPEGVLAVAGGTASMKVTSDKPMLDLDKGIILLYHLGFLTRMNPEEAKRRVSAYQDRMVYLRIPNLYFRELFSRYRLFRYPRILSVVSTDLWGLGQLAKSNDISCLEAMLRSLAGAFVRTADPHEGESQIVLTVYVALSLLAGSFFDLRREYFIRHDCKYVLSDGLEESEYADIDEAEVEHELISTGIIEEPSEHRTVSVKGSDGSPADGRGSTAGRSSPKGSGGFRKSFLDRAETRKAISVRRGRADLVALNRGTGPSYLFEFKYQRDSNAREETKDRVCELLYSRAVRQLNFYVTDDRLSQIRDLHRYVIMYAYGEFFIGEVA